MTDRQPDPDISEALRLLGKERFLLAIHDASFPGIAGQDTGRGTPYGWGAASLAEFARGLGFNGLQLGPQGQTSNINPSPYDGTLFSRSLLSLDLHALAHDPAWFGLLSREAWAEAVAGNPRPDGLRVAYTSTFATYAHAMDEVMRNFRTTRNLQLPAAVALDADLRAFWNAHRWLRDDALYEALSAEHGQLPWRQWPTTGNAALDRALCAPPSGLEAACAARRGEIETRHGDRIERYTLLQFILLRQHMAFRERMQKLGLKIYGDVQVGFSLRDIWSRQSLLLAGYFMGAPPSRTNLDGQPWSYQVLDPVQYITQDGSPGPVLAFAAERLGKMLAEFDGLRLDHPHGLVCPWVYRDDDPDPYHAVQNGARLFSAPDLPDHPALARHAIVSAPQINRDLPRYADGWVMNLTPEQEDRYALLVDTLMVQALEHGRQKEDILCEVLSTEPYPLFKVRTRHGLGRFRVTQKADLDNPGDVYRSENAQAEDWVMVGNHDTPPIWRLARLWQGQEAGRKQAAYLASRLRPEAPAAFAASLAGDYRKLVHAKVADLFLSPARNVMIFFADLFGQEEIYNMPGTVNDENWTLRVPPDYAARHQSGRRNGEVLNLHATLALALRARPDLASAHSALVARLQTEAGWSVE